MACAILFSGVPIAIAGGAVTAPQPGSAPEPDLEISVSTPDAELSLEGRVTKTQLFFHMGAYQVVLSDGETLLREIETQRSKKDPLAGELHYLMGVASLNRGEDRDALKHLRKARSILGDHEPERLPAIYRARGDALLGLGKFADAYTAYKSALSYTEDVYGETSLPYSDELIAMAKDELKFKGNWLKASGYADRAARIRAQLLGEDDPLVAHALLEKATMYMSGLRDREAIDPAEKAVAILDAAGPEAAGSATSGRSLLAVIYERAGEPEKAREVMARIQSTGGPRPRPMVREIPNCPLGVRHGSWAVYEFAVTEEGRVEDVKFVRGWPEDFALSKVRDATKSWRYAPAMRNGVPVRAEGVRWSFSCSTDKVYERNRKKGSGGRI